MTETMTAPVQWRLDGEGYLRWRGTGFIVFRVDGDGTIYLWDRWARDPETGKRKPAERALTMDDLQRFVYARRQAEVKP